eukprot:g1413.t1
MSTKGTELEDGAKGAAKEAVLIRNLDFSYKSKQVLTKINLTLPLGARCLLVGDNGAGKTTLLRILGGKHHIDDADSKLSILGQESMFSPKLNLLRSYLGGDWGKRTVAFVGYGVPMTADIRVENMMKDLQDKFPKRKERLYNLLDIDPQWNMSEVSDGQRRRVQIMLGLIRPFELLLLDEITTDLDVVTRQDLLKFLREETEERKVTIVYATHIFDGLDGWPTRVFCLHKGKVSYDDAAPKDMRLMDAVATWIRAGRKESKAIEKKLKMEGKSTKRTDSIRPDGSAGGFAPGRLARFMAYG